MRFPMSCCMMGVRYSLFGLAALLAGCAGAPPPNVSPGLRVELPTYKPGDSFVFDDGSSERVVAIDGEQVTWERGTGSRFVSYRNFALPILSWRNRTNAGQRELQVEPTALWPLGPGSRAEFRETTTVAANNGVETRERLWRCRLEGEERTRVPVGTFDTVIVACRQPARGAFGRTQLERRWYYAPALGHYVKETEARFRQAPKSRHLVEVVRTAEEPLLSPLPARLQAVLESEPTGQQASWQSEAAYRATVLRTVRLARGNYCRDFELMRTSGASTVRWVARACRVDDARWELRRQDNGQVVDARS
jgi:hypothetical protein